MAKFYVRCGMRNVIVDAADAQAAAMHLIDTAMEPHVWVYDDPGLSDAERQDHLMLEALLHMSPEIRVSQKGHGRDDAIVIGTPETIQAWHQTMTGLSNLLISAGLCPRPMRQLAVAPAELAAEAPSRTRSGLDLRPIRRAK